MQINLVSYHLGRIVTKLQPLNKIKTIITIKVILLQAGSLQFKILIQNA